MDACLELKLERTQRFLVNELPLPPESYSS